MNVKKCVRALLCLYLTLIIAMDAVKAQALKVGDTLPPELWSMPLEVINHPQGKETLTLSEYRDKLIILDFWATWCAPCIKSLTKLDTLQREFGEQLAVVPVSGDDPDKIRAFIEKKRWHLSSLTNKNYLKGYFPHQSIPHYVWISEGKVASVTGHDEVSRQSIRDFLKGEGKLLRQKEDLMEFSYTRPLFFEGNGGDGSSVQYHTLLSGPIKGLTSIRSSILNKSTALHSRIFGVNCSIIELYKIAVEEIKQFSKNRFVIDSTLRNRLVYDESAGDKTGWIAENTYCYEKRVPPTAAKPLKQLMKEDLDLYFNLKTAYKKQVVDCYILSLNPRTELTTSGGEPASFFYDPAVPVSITNRPVAVLMEYLNHKLPLPVINETGLTQHFDLQMPHTDNVDSLKSALGRYGFELTKTRRETEVFIIEEDKPLLP